MLTQISMSTSPITCYSNRVMYSIELINYNENQYKGRD